MMNYQVLVGGMAVQKNVLIFILCPFVGTYTLLLLKVTRNLLSRGTMAAQLFVKDFPLCLGTVVC